jgi:uncharacterized protein
MKDKGDRLHIFITGGLGFVGRHLSLAFLQAGHRVTAVGRSRNPSAMIDHPSFTYQAVDTTESGDWQVQLSSYDVIINLAGKSIFTLWTDKVKKEIYDSRILTTRNLVDGLAGSRDIIFFNTSAVGYYGDRGEDILTEEEPAGDDFLAHLGKAWEEEALRAQSHGVRVVLTRFGIVLDRTGGAMAMMIPAFKMFLGGHLGNGRQWFPWIHINDLIAAYQFVMDHNEISGPVNFCAPRPVRNENLAKTLSRKLNRPAVFPAPAFMVKTFLGEFGEVLLCSQRAKPAVLENAGFSFTFADIDSALEEIVNR